MKSIYEDSARVTKRDMRIVLVIFGISALVQGSYLLWVLLQW